MKKFILAFASAVALLFTTGCEPNKIKDSEVELNVSVKEASFTCGGGSVYFTINCNTDWHITGMGKGITVTNSSGEADEKFNVGIIAEENINGGEINVTLEVKAGSTVREIAVRQDAAGVATIDIGDSGRPLYEFLPESEESKSLIRKITIKGWLPAQELTAIANLPNIEYVDLSGTHIDIVPNSAFAREGSKLEEIILPPDVKSIEEGAFAECRNLKKVVLAEGLEIIGPFAFTGCVSLTDINIPESVLNIREGAFSECSSLKKIDLPAGLLAIERKAFEKCAALDNVRIPDKVTIIDEYAFAGCESLKTFSLGSGVNVIGAHAFEVCKSLTEFTFPQSVTIVAERVFSACGNLKTVILGGSVTYIGKGAFANCTSLSAINLPDPIETIEEYAFTSCESLQNITLPENVKTIGQHAFSDCYALVSFSIPASVTSIGDYMFYQCEQLATIYCRITTPLLIESYTLYGVKSGCSLRVPASSVEAYENARYWNKLTVSAI